MGPGEALSPYLGVFPLLLAIIGFWKHRDHPWVRYAAGLAFAAFLFSLGASSLLYGLIYALAPLLWMAREASRFLYIAHFGLVILAAYGAQTLFCGTEAAAAWARLNRILMWAAIASAGVWAIPYVFGQPVLKPWTEWSLLFIILTYPLFRYVSGGGIGDAGRFLVVAFIVVRSAFVWHRRLQQNRGGAQGCGPARTADQHARRGGFSQSAAGAVSSSGDRAAGAEYRRLLGDRDTQRRRGHARVQLYGSDEQRRTEHDLLNVRYFLKPASAADPNPVYADANWKIYANPSACPRAWIEPARG